MKKFEPSLGIIIILAIINVAIFFNNYPEEIKIATNKVKIKLLHLKICHARCKTFAELNNISAMLEKMQRAINKSDKKGEDTLERKRLFNFLFLSFQKEIEKIGEPNYAVFLSNLKPYKI